MPTFTYNDSPERKLYEEPGEHHLTVDEANFEFARGSGNEILKLKLVTDGGVVVFDNLVFTEKAWWKIDHFFKAFLPSKGRPLPKKGDNIEMDDQWVEDNIRGASGYAELSKGTSTSGKIRNEVQRYLAGPTRKPGSGKSPAPTTKPATPLTSPESPTTKETPTTKDKSEDPF